MTRHKVVCENASFHIEIPDSLDRQAKDLLKVIVEHCIEKMYWDSIREAIDNMVNSTEILVTWLKESKYYDKKLESGIRKFMAIHLNHGFELGMNIMPASGDDDEEDDMDERRSVEDILTSQLDIKRTVKKMAKSKQNIGEVILYCLDLGTLAHETGFALAGYLSQAMMEKHYDKLKEESRYIG